MFWLRNYSYLITSSSSSTLLLDILIFHSDVSQSLFCLIICCIQQFHWLLNNSLHFGVDFFFQLQNGKKSSTRKRNSVFSRSAGAKLKIFLSAKKILKWTPAFIVRKEKSSIRGNKKSSISW